LNDRVITTWVRRDQPPFILAAENRAVFDERLLPIASGQPLNEVILGRVIWQWSSLEGL